MPSRKRVIVDQITFDLSAPTPVPLQRLHTWVVWQFPRLRPEGYSGAVHPPEAGYGCYPAVIDALANLVLVYANVKERFPTPEAAARHLDQVAG